MAALAQGNTVGLETLRNQFVEQQKTVASQSKTIVDQQKQIRNLGVKVLANREELAASQRASIQNAIALKKSEEKLNNLEKTNSRLKVAIGGICMVLLYIVIIL